MIGDRRKILKAVDIALETPAKTLVAFIFFNGSDG